MRIVGIDLAGKAENKTGFCVMIGACKEFPLGKTETKILYTDLEILKEIEEIKPKCIAIDAPFWLPKAGAWRPCEQALMERGFRPLSPILPTMRMLTLRAMHLVAVLRQRNYQVIEVFPRATEEILKLSKAPRKSEHAYDALLCALTAKAYLKGNYEDLEGIIIPKLS